MSFSDIFLAAASNPDQLKIKETENGPFQRGVVQSRCNVYCLWCMIHILTANAKSNQWLRRENLLIWIHSPLFAQGAFFTRRQFTSRPYVEQLECHWRIQTSTYYARIQLVCPPPPHPPQNSPFPQRPRWTWGCLPVTTEGRWRVDRKAICTQSPVHLAGIPFNLPFSKYFFATLR